MDVAKSGLDQDSLNQSGLGSESTHPLRKKPGRKKRPFILCDICGVDLKHHKSYYKRYRTCADCASKERINIDGVWKRFCQQCGKFQPVEEFDGLLKTCSEGLKVHAMRRRKGNARGRINKDAVKHSHSEDRVEIGNARKDMRRLHRYGRSLPVIKVQSLSYQEGHLNSYKGDKVPNEPETAALDSMDCIEGDALLWPSQPNSSLQAGNDANYSLHRCIRPIALHFGNSMSGHYDPELAQRNLQSVLSTLRRPTNPIIFASSYPFRESLLSNRFRQMQ